VDESRRDSTSEILLLKKQLEKGTMKAIIKDIGLTQEEFFKRV
jgi:hypothetical protein